MTSVLFSPFLPFHVYLPSPKDKCSQGIRGKSNNNPHWIKQGGYCRPVPERGYAVTVKRQYCCECRSGECRDGRAYDVTVRCTFFVIFSCLGSRSVINHEPLILRSRTRKPHLLCIVCRRTKPAAQTEKCVTLECTVEINENRKMWKERVSEKEPQYSLHFFVCLESLIIAQMVQLERT